MSSILPFVVVAVMLAIGASVAITAGTQPATDEDRSPRDPWSDRVRPVVQWLRRSALDTRRWVAAAWADRSARRTARRAQQAEDRSRQLTEKPSHAPEVEHHPRPSARPPAVTGRAPTAVTPPVEGVVATALRVHADPATTRTAGDVVSGLRPSLWTRLRSAIGLVLLIAVLGLALAAVFGAVVAGLGAALDGMVN